MRKIDYTRKPKRAFVKIKSIYGDDNAKAHHDSTISPPTFDEIINKQKTRSLFDSKVFSFIKAALALAILVLIFFL